MRFTVLASGSSGNASLLEVTGQSILIDLGLGARRLGQALEVVGTSWENVDAAVLSHTHGDHVQESTLKQLARLGKPLWCHADHADKLSPFRPWAELRRKNLIQHFRDGDVVSLASSVSLRVAPLCHDGGATCGFRFEAVDFLGITQALGYATDLGCWDADLVEAFTDVDILALEFNHDVALEMNSGRAPHLIARVLGDRGHLSNEQAARLVGEVLRRSQPGRLQHLVQLHLSRHCNHPDLARAAAAEVLAKCGALAHVHTARQHKPGPTLRLGTQRRVREAHTCSDQPLFADWEN